MVITCCFCWGLMNLVLVIVFLNCILELLFLGSGLYRFLFALCGIFEVWLIKLVYCNYILLLACFLFWDVQCQVQRSYFCIETDYFIPESFCAPKDWKKERVAFHLHLGDWRSKQPGELVTKPSIFFIMQLWTEDSIGDIWSPRCSHIRFLWFHCSSDSSENVHLTKTWLFYLLTCMW